MIVRVAQIILMIAAAGLTYWAWTQLNLLRGTIYFEYRYVLLACGAILLFSVAQSIVGRLAARLEPEDH